MKLRRRSGRGFEETNASSDVAFLLIIYFIVIAGFNVNKGFLMTLPARDSTRLILKDDLLRFDVDGSGNLFHQGSLLSHAQAEREIQGATASHPNLAVILTVDGAAPWQAVVSFVELAQRLEVESFSFTMKKDDGGSL